MDLQKKNGNKKKPIQTFVFFDLESSGLKMDSRMIELAMIAISRNDLLGMVDSENSSTLPKMARVTHKLVKLFYPKRIICREVEDICGLSNEALHHLSPFNEVSAKSIVNFLQLPEPICLIAHNGDKFDFPLLKAELNSVFYGDIDVLCADSLTCFRSLDIESQDITETVRLCNEMTDDEFYENGMPTKKIATEIDDSLILDSTSTNLLPSEVTPVIFTTPKKSIIRESQPPAVPSKISTNGSIELKVKRRKIGNGRIAKRRLVYSSYKQPDIYNRLFNCSYDAHSAEHDAIALLNISAFYGKSFVEWCDNHSKLFSQVKQRCQFKRPWNLSQEAN